LHSIFNYENIIKIDKNTIMSKLYPFNIYFNFF